jgi:hypothetical protein
VARNAVTLADVDTKTRWIGGLVVLAAGVAVWRVMAVRPERERGAPALAARAPEAGQDASRGAPEGRAAPRVPVRSAGEPNAAADPLEQGEFVDPRPPLVRALEELTATFLTTEPRVADLLGLSHDLAAQAVLSRESLQVERDGEGGLRFARGDLVAGDLRGSFLIDDGVYLVRFSSDVGEAPWARYDLQISFSEGDSRATSCQANVQFHPRPGEVATWYLAPEEEKLAGWAVGVSPDTGALLRPITVGAAEDEWRIGTGLGVDAREFPWISNTAGFDAWLRLLQGCAER